MDRNILNKQEVQYLNDLTSKMNKPKLEKSEENNDNEGSQIANNAILSRNQKASELITKHKGKVFKDKDLIELGFKLRISKSNASNLLECINDDLSILKKYNLTDYSLLVSIHTKNNKEYSTTLYPPVRVIESSKGDLIYCLSLIDFLAEFGFNKTVEKKFKLLTHYVKGDKDNNISAEEPERYANRMSEFIEKHCLEIIES